MSTEPRLGAIVGVGALGAAAWLARSAAIMLDGPPTWSLAAAVTAAGVLGLVAPGLGIPLVLATIAGLLVFGYGTLAARWISTPSRPSWVAMAIVGLAALADVAAISLRVGIAPLGVVVAAIGAAIARLEMGRARRSEAPGADSSIALLVATGLTLSGIALATGTPTAMLMATAAATFATCAAAVRFDRALLLWPALALSVVTYFLLPAPVRELVTELRARVAGELGYEPQALPLSFYGVTFLPYLAAGGIIAEWLRRKGRESFARVTLAWTLSVAIALAVLSVVAGQDARAPMAVLPAEGALLLALGAWTKSQRLVFAGFAGLLGGVVAGLVHLEPSKAVTLEVLAAAGLALFAVAALLQRGAPAEAFRRRASHAALDASALFALLTIAWTPTLWIGGEPPGPRHTPGLLLLAVWVGALTRAFATPISSAFAWGAAALALLVALGPDALGAPNTALWLALASAIPLVTARWRTPRLVERPIVNADPERSLSIEIGAPVIQLVAMAALLERVQGHGASGVVAMAAVTAACILSVGGVLRAATWMVSIAGLQLIAGVLLGTSALDFDLRGFASTAALGISALVLGVMANGPRRDERLAPLAIAGDLALAACVAAVGWAVISRIHAGGLEGGVNPGVLLPPWLDAKELAIGSVAVLLATFAAARARTREDHLFVARAIAAVASPLAVVAICDVLGARGGAFAFGFAVSATASGVLLRRRLPEQAVIHAVLATLVAVIRLWPPATGDAWLSAALALVAGTCLLGSSLRGASPPETARPHPLSTFIGLTAITTLAWCLWTWAWPDTDPWWLPTFVIGGAAAAALLSRARALRLDPTGSTAYVSLIAAVCLLLGAAHTVACLFSGEAPVLSGQALAPVNSMGFTLLVLAAGMATNRQRAPRLSLVLATGIAISAAFLVPVAERWLLDEPRRTALPAIELAVLAIGAGLVRARVVTFGLMIGAALVTGFAFARVTTPVAFAVLPFASLVLGLRTRRAGDIATFADGLLIAGLALILHLRHPGQVDALPWFGAMAALLSLGLVPVVLILAKRDGFATECSMALGRAVVRAGDVAILLIATAIVAGLASGTSGELRWPVWPAVVATAIPAVLAVAIARRTPAPIVAHRLVAALVIAYGYLTIHTDALDLLGSQKANLLTFVAVGLLLAQRSFPTSMAKALSVDALLLPIPAVLAIGTTPSIDGAVTLALASAPYAVAARMLDWRWAAWLAALLINGAVWTLWLHRGIVDAAFYGVPLGLTLAVGSEFARHRTARAITRVLGLTILYGSIAAQVLRVEEPTHALALFALGLVAVVFGRLRRRNDLLLAGTAAVVIDVVAYLLRHGLARDFVGAGLLVAAGVTVLFAAVATRRRANQDENDSP